MLSVATELTDADRAMYHALELGSRRCAISDRPSRSLARRTPPVGDHDHTLGELGALGGLAVEAILRPTASAVPWSCAPA
jgi:hypothetical protein